MKITQQLLEEMIKEELDEGWRDVAGGLGIIGTLAGLFLAAHPHIDQMAQDKQYKIMQSVLENIPEDERAEKAQAVIDGTDEQLQSLPPKSQKVAVKVAQDYLTNPSGGVPPLPENRSRLEQLIAEELEKVLKA